MSSYSRALPTIERLSVDSVRYAPFDEEPRSADSAANGDAPPAKDKNQKSGREKGKSKKKEQRKGKGKKKKDAPCTVL
jgi:hypothetical protein